MKNRLPFDPSRRTFPYGTRQVNTEIWLGPRIAVNNFNAQP
jgi:hypothetical protein